MTKKQKRSEAARYLASLRKRPGRKRRTERCPCGKYTKEFAEKNKPRHHRGECAPAVQETKP